jgi:hypothetical protein
MEPTQVGSGEVVISTSVGYELEDEEEEVVVVVLNVEELVSVEELKSSGTIMDEVDISVLFSLKLLPS